MMYYSVVGYKPNTKTLLAYLPAYRAIAGNLIEIDLGGGDTEIYPVESVIIDTLNEDEIRNLIEIGAIRKVQRVFAQCWQDDGNATAQKMGSTVCAEWQDDGNGDHACSNCGYNALSEDYDGMPVEQLSNYCPHCGFKMEGAVDDETD